MFEIKFICKSSSYYIESRKYVSILYPFVEGDTLEISELNTQVTTDVPLVPGTAYELCVKGLYGGLNSPKMECISSLLSFYSPEVLRAVNKMDVYNYLNPPSR